MVRLFGTDGVRGVAGEDLTGQLAMDVARAAASVLHNTGAFAAAEDRAAARWRSSAATPGPRGSSSRRRSWPGWPGRVWTCCGSA